jgi:hypothetical protein
MKGQFGVWRLNENILAPQIQEQFAKVSTAAPEMLSMYKPKSVSLKDHANTHPNWA